MTVSSGLIDSFLDLMEPFKDVMIKETFESLENDP